MKNKITIITTLVIALLVVTAFSVKAEDGENKAENRNKASMQTTTQMGDEGDQMDNEDMMDGEDSMDNEDEMDSENEIDSEDMMNEGDGEDMMDDEDMMDNSGEEEKDDHEKMSDERKNNVASAVEEILRATEKHEGIGEEVKAIALDQVVNQDAIETSLKEVESRGSFMKFLIGPKYSIINNAKKLIEKNKEHINKLNEINKALSSAVDSQKVTDQVSVLEQSSKQVEDYIKQSEEAFSLFGWLLRIFSK